MNKQRVRKISPVSAIAQTSPSSIYRSQSPFADLEGRLVAQRQSSINARLERRAEIARNERDIDPKYSVESGRVSARNCDETAEFGSRTWYV
jgi:hypothetical protein